MAARRIAAAQPSVRSQSASISAFVSSAATSPSISRVSSTVIASSAALISRSCPERRYRSSGIGGSDLVEAMDVVQDQHHRGVMLRDLVDQQRRGIEGCASTTLDVGLAQPWDALRD